MSETPGEVFEAVLNELQGWRWERWTTGSAAEFQKRLDEEAKQWRERFDAAESRLIEALKS